MKKNRIKIAGGCLLVVFVFMLPFVSLLGENDRAITVVNTYFENIQAKKYQENERLCTQAYKESFPDLAAHITHQFALETALLNYFSLPLDSRYSITAKKSRVWFPFLGDNTLKLSLRVNLQKSESLLKNYLKLGGGEFLSEIIVMEREDGSWKINNIEISHPSLKADYLKTVDAMEQSSFMMVAGNDLTINTQQLDLTEIDNIEKRIMVFNLQKILTLINEKK